MSEETKEVMQQTEDEIQTTEEAPQENKIPAKPKKSRGTLIAGIIAAVVVIGLIAAVFAFGPKPQSGSKAITIIVTDDHGVETVYESRTDAEYLLDAAKEIDGLEIEGTEGEYGLYINTINGVTADYSVDQSYWAIFVNGDYGTYGIESQPVADGDTYSFVYLIVWTD